MTIAIGAELVDQLATRADLEATRVVLEGKILLLQWMLGFVLAGVVALLWRAFG